MQPIENKEDKNALHYVNVSEIIESIGIKDILKFAELGRIFGGLVHDLNNQHMVTANYLDLLRSTETAVREDQKQFLEEAVKSQTKASEILTQTLQWIRGGEYTWTSVKMEEVMDKAVETVRSEPDFQHSSVQLKKHYECKLPGIMADAVQLERVFVNLIRNAHQTLQDSGIGSKINIFLWAEGKWVCAVIRDDGAGLPDFILSNPGKPLASTRKHKGGSGLGLMIVKDIVREHSGKMEIWNLPEGGAEFTLYFPVSQTARQRSVPLPESGGNFSTQDKAPSFFKDRAA